MEGTFIDSVMAEGIRNSAPHVSCGCWSEAIVGNGLFGRIIR